MRSWESVTIRLYAPLPLFEALVLAPAVVLKPEEGLSTSFMLVRNQDPMETV